MRTKRYIDPAYFSVKYNTQHLEKELNALSFLFPKTVKFGFLKNDALHRKIKRCVLHAQRIDLANERRK